ncbi:MAG: hypothetical protein P8R46_10030 [Planctomycetota bacterium]|nr:hypothetical protein [Planctomycetota bacterium]
MVPPDGPTKAKRKTAAGSRDPKAARAASARHASHDGGDRQASSGKSSTSCDKEHPPKDPCYLYKMAIKETWPAPPDPPAPAAARPRAEVEADLKQRDHDLLKVQEDLEAEQSKWFPASDKLKQLRQARDEHQAETMALLIEYGTVSAKPSAKRAPSKDRAFSVVRFMPPEWIKSLDDAQAKMRALTSDLKTLFDDWDREHEAHEALKQRLRAFHGELEEKQREVDRVQAALERRRRRTKMREKRLDEADRRVSESSNRVIEYWNKRGRATTLNNLERSREKEKDLRLQLKAAEADQRRAQASLDKLERDQAKASRDLTATHAEITTKTDALRDLEAGVLEVRNTLVSPATINVIAGSREPWYLSFVGKTTVEKGGKNKKSKAAAKPDGTPSISVEIDPNNDAGFSVRHPKGYPWGPSKVGRYCKADPPPSRPPGPHPFVDCVINPDSKQDPWPFPVASARGKDIKFEAWQAKQFDETLQVRALTPWNKVVRSVRVMKEVFSSSPRTGSYELEARACGFKPSGRTRNVTDALRATVVTFPSDSFEFILKTSAFSGKDYSREATVANAAQRATAAGRQDGTPSDATDRSQVTTTHTSRSAFGMVSKSEVVTDVTGTVDGNIATSRTTENIDVDRGTEDYLKDGKVDPQRVPAFDSTFFPLCPVDVSFKRNDLEDEFTKDVKGVISTVVLISRELANNAGKLSNFIPSVGWGFKFSFDVLKGDFSYFKQHREHVDRRVYVYSRAKVDITCFSTAVSLYGGVWLDVAFVQFKAVVELELKGSVGIKGQVESTHPDAIVSRNVGFGPTGAVAAQVQIKIIVGRPDWCSAASGLKTGIDVEMLAWAQQTSGPHLDWNAKFTGVKAFVTAKLALVGSYEYERTFAKERTIASGRFPKTTEADELAIQNEEMDKLANEARREAAENLESEESHRAHRSAVRSGR